MLASYRKVLTVVLLLGDVALIGGAFLAAHWIRAHLRIFEYGSLLPLEKCLAILPLAAFVWVVVYACMGLYSLSRPRPLSEWFTATLFSSGLALVLLLALAFMLHEFNASRLMLIDFCALAALATGLLRIGLQAIVLQLANRGHGLGNILIVGRLPAVERMCGWITMRPGWGLRPIPFNIDDCEANAPALARAIEVYYPQHLLFIGEVPEELVAVCDAAGVRPRFAPDMPPISLLRLTLEPIAGLPSLCLKEACAHPVQQELKRAIDIVLASCFLLLSSPVFAVVAVLIKLDSPGPIFFRQRRIGKDGQPFAILKFRSMLVEAAQAPPQKVEGREDPRLTRVGAWLRKLSLDELPQLINVLQGQMSLVGPRPETPLYVNQYSDWNRLRLLVKPGMAGMAQANGVRGNTTIDQKTVYDLAYIEAQSPVMDLALIAKTVLTLPLHRDAY